MTVQSNTRDAVQAMVDTGLLGQWYALMPAAWVTNKPVGVTRLNKRLVLWRDDDGVAHVQYDRCPHRGAALSGGEVIDGLLTCPYHGIQIDGEGVIASVPALPGCQIEGMKGVETFASIEKAGCIFAYFPSAAQPEPTEMIFPEEFEDPEWGHMLCTAYWEGNHMLAFDNLVDPMHGSYLHASSYTLAYGAKEDRMAIDKTKTGFIIRREEQQGVNFDWTEYGYTGADWVRLDIPYPKSAGPGGDFRILGFVTPVDADRCQVFFWRMRKVSGWQRDVWKFMYKMKLEKRHWDVLEQDRIAIEQMEVPESEMLYQHDIGVTQLRRIVHKRAKDVLKAGGAAAAE
jgi:phenylpropionate dioxygenase-like ring-hydroxylating dioxygenase large terminal subunit